MTDVSQLPPDDPLRREAQTFPRLSTDMITRIAAHGVEEILPAGAFLFRQGDRGTDFFVVHEGAVEVFEVSPEGEELRITTHKAGQFTGDVDLFNQRKVLVNGRTLRESRVIRVARAKFRPMLAAESDIAELLMRAFILRRVGLIRHATAGVAVIGPGHSGDTMRLERFLARNGYPHRLLDTELDPETDEWLSCLEVHVGELPVVVVPGGTLLRNPSVRDLADALGITEFFDPAHVHDVAVIGAGPAGLAAAVYAASEGLDTIVVECMAPGGQAGTSSRIENYLGFPTGITGQALAGRAQVQAQKFGARLAIARLAKSVECDEQPFRVRLEDDSHVSARAIVIATGATYRKLDVPDYARFESNGIHYAATGTEARICGGTEVVVVGGGNSAGQAAVFLSGIATHVYVIVRGDGLAATMSDYLVQRIQVSRHITLLSHTEIVGLHGERLLERVTWRNKKTGEEDTRPVTNIFVMIGAAPNTAFLDGCVELDDNGFICTGRAPQNANGQSPYVTSRAGVFAVGDVRGGSVKRVASAVGEGAVVVHAVHRYLSGIG